MTLPCIELVYFTMRIYLRLESHPPNPHPSILWEILGQVWKLPTVATMAVWFPTWESDSAGRGAGSTVAHIPTTTSEQDNPVFGWTLLIDTKIC